MRAVCSNKKHSLTEQVCRSAVKTAQMGRKERLQLALQTATSVLDRTGALPADESLKARVRFYWDLRLWLCTLFQSLG